MNTMDGDAEYRERDRLWRQRQRESDPSVREKERDYSQAYYQKSHEIINKKSEETTRRTSRRSPRQGPRTVQTPHGYAPRRSESQETNQTLVRMRRKIYFRPQIYPCSVEKTSGILFQYPFINKRLPSILFLFESLPFSFHQQAKIAVISHTNLGSPHVRNLTLPHNLFHLFKIKFRELLWKKEAVLKSLGRIYAGVVGENLDGMLGSGLDRLVRSLPPQTPTRSGQRSFSQTQIQTPFPLET